MPKKSEKPKIPSSVLLHYLLIGFMSGSLTGVTILLLGGYMMFALFLVSSLACWMFNEWRNTSTLEDWGVMEKKKPKTKPKKEKEN